MLAVERGALSWSDVETEQLLEGQRCPLGADEAIRTWTVVAVHERRRAAPARASNNRGDRCTQVERFATARTTGAVSSEGLTDAGGAKHGFRDASNALLAQRAEQRLALGQRVEVEERLEALCFTVHIPLALHACVYDGADSVRVCHGDRAYAGILGVSGDERLLLLALRLRIVVEEGQHARGSS